MSVTTPQGPVPAIAIPDSQDYPRLVYTAPYFQTVALAEILDPAVQEAVESMLPTLVPPFVDEAAANAVATTAVLLTGSTMVGPLMLNPTMPTADSMAASKAYVDAMISTAGIPEVPPVPVGQIWGRETGQWTPIGDASGTFLPISGGTMQGQINMSGNTITNMAAVPNMPNGAAPAQWVLNQIAAQSLYQGTWIPDTNSPDLTQPGNHQNGFTWIVSTTTTGGVVVTPPIPGLQGKTVFNGDTVIYSAIAGQFQLIQAGGLTVEQGNALYLQLNGGQMSGPLMLNADATSAMQATTLEQVQAMLPDTINEAPADGQVYGRNGNAHVWLPVLPLGGGVLTGNLFLNGNATNALQAVPLQQLQSYTAQAVAPYLPLTGGTLSGALTLAAVATATMQPVTLGQMNASLAQVGAAPGVSPPASPTPGKMWWDSNGAQLYVWTGSQWVIAVNPPIPNLANYLPLTGGTISGSLTVTNGLFATNGMTLPNNVAIWTQAPSGGAAIPLIYLDTADHVIIDSQKGTGGTFIYADGSGPLTLIAPSGECWLTLDVNDLSTHNWAVKAGGGNSFAVADLTVSVNRLTIDGVGNLILLTNAAFVPANTNSGQVGTAGAGWYAMSAYAFDNLSDPRMKRDVAPAPAGALEKVKALPVINYRTIAPPPDKDLNGNILKAEHVPPPPNYDQLRIGFNATDVHKVHPDAVTLHPEDGQPAAYSLSDMNALLWQAVQELTARLEALEGA